MKSLALAFCMCVTCAQAETFVERWPVVEAVAPAPVVERAIIEKPLKAVRRSRAQQRGFVCHRQTYTIHKHRYWRCRR